MAAGWRVYVCTSLNTLFPLRFGENTQQTSGNKIVMQFLVRCSYTFGFISWKWHAFAHNECYDVCLCMPRTFLETQTTTGQTKTRKREKKQKLLSTSSAFWHAFRTFCRQPNSDSSSKILFPTTSAIHICFSVCQSYLNKT